MSLFKWLKKNDAVTQEGKNEQSQQTQLPEDFAQRVMELEMEAEFDEACGLQKIQQLNQLYKDAIEHYSTIDMKKAQHFQRKLTNLLINPATIHIIHPKTVSVKTAHIDINGYQKKLRHQLNLFNSQSTTLVKSMIVGSDKKIQNQNRLIDNHLQRQENNLRNRIEARCHSKVNGS